MGNNEIKQNESFENYIKSLESNSNVDIVKFEKEKSLFKTRLFKNFSKNDSRKVGIFTRFSFLFSIILIIVVGFIFTKASIIKPSDSDINSYFESAQNSLDSNVTKLQESNKELSGFDTEIVQLY